MLLLLNIDFYVFLKIPSVLYVPFEVPQQSNNSKTGAGNTHITHILTTSESKRNRTDLTRRLKACLTRDWNKQFVAAKKYLSRKRSKESLSDKYYLRYKLKGSCINNINDSHCFNLMSYSTQWVQIILIKLNIPDRLYSKPIYSTVRNFNF